jgi:hypothetical protein
MNRFHSMYWLMKYLDKIGEIDNVIEWAKENDFRYNENPLPGEAPVWEVLKSYAEEYKKEKK